VAGFYAARDGAIPPLPWTNFAPPLSRLPGALKDTLEGLAKNNNRTLSAEIISRLEESIVGEHTSGLDIGDLKVLSSFVSTLTSHVHGKSQQDMMEGITSMYGGRYVWTDRDGHALRSNNSELLTEAVAGIHRLRSEINSNSG
jgi:hypothetical protein